ncbi:hypothetical protein GCM10010254_73020 [Streptomyces chromofuscus]|nr:hypothetical protein GCM10010254_73020 [Streptomyces chromofuscus]
MTDRPDTTAKAHTESLTARMPPLGRVGEAGRRRSHGLYVVSETSTLTTGQIIRLNGGVAMPW